MNSRRDGAISFGISAGAFETEDECNIALETILRYVEREHIKRRIPICGYAVSSCSKNGTIEWTPWGRKLKPNTSLSDYHIHTYFYTDAFSTSVKIIREYVMKKYGKGKIRHGKTLRKNMFWIKELKTLTDVKRWTYYCIGQGLRIRKITKACNEEFVKKYCMDFILTAEKANKRIGAIRPLFPQYHHLLPVQIYDNKYTQKPQWQSRILDGGVDNDVSIQVANRPHSASEKIPFNALNKPKSVDLCTSGIYQDPFSEDVLNSNIIRDIRDNNSIYNHTLT